MSKMETAVRLAEQIAADNSIGYQWGGWGPSTGGYDCGHLIIDCFERAGYGVKAAGATYTGNMRPVFLSRGFSDVTAGVNINTGAGLRRGDVLLNQASHAALYIGSGRIVQARSNLDGVPGDSSGQEIRVQGYYNYPWDCVLRPPAEITGTNGGGVAAPDLPPGPGTTTGSTIKSATRYQVDLPLLQYGDRGEIVKALQLLLIGRGYTVGGSGADGVFGSGTRAGLVNFQRQSGLDADGKAGGQSWAALLGLAEVGA